MRVPAIRLTENGEPATALDVGPRPYLLCKRQPDGTWRIEQFADREAIFLERNLLKNPVSRWQALLDGAPEEQTPRLVRILSLLITNNAAAPGTRFCVISLFIWRRD